MINGGFRETEADRRVSDLVKAVNMEVPSLFSRTLPHSGKQCNGESRIRVIDDPAHGSSTGINRIKPRYCQEQLNLPLLPVDNDPNWNEDMKMILRDAYRRDYKIKATLMGDLALRWYTKFSFDDLQ